MPVRVAGRGRPRRPGRWDRVTRGRVLARDRLLRARPRHPLELRRGLRRQRGAVLHEPGGGVGRQVAGAQLLGRALQALDELVERSRIDVVGHGVAEFSCISRRAAARMPFHEAGRVGAAERSLGGLDASEMAPSGGIGRSPGATSGWSISSSATTMARSAVRSGRASSPSRGARCTGRGRARSRRRRASARERRRVPVDQVVEPAAGHVLLVQGEDRCAPLVLSSGHGGRWEATARWAGSGARHVVARA